MRRIFMVAIVAANLALTASAALAEGNAYHEPFYLASSSTGPFYPATSNTVRTARAGATTIGAVTGPGISPCPVLCIQARQPGALEAGCAHVTFGKVSGDQDPNRTWFRESSGVACLASGTRYRSVARVLHSQLFLAANRFEKCPVRYGKYAG